MSRLRNKSNWLSHPAFASAGKVKKQGLKEPRLNTDWVWQLQ
jgi:hypothetical protein